MGLIPKIRAVPVARAIPVSIAQRLIITHWKYVTIDNNDVMD